MEEEAVENQEEVEVKKGEVRKVEKEDHVSRGQEAAGEPC